VPAIIAEGTAYSLAQLLNELNKAPEAWTANWLRTLGFMQIASAPAVVGLVFTRTETEKSLIIDKGLRVSTQSGVIFKTSEVIDYLPGQSTVSVVAVCETPGTVGNVPARTVTRLLRSIPNLIVTNPVSAYGGRNGESWQDTKGRAFNSLRRRNPVSVVDWSDWFRHMLGDNTQVVVVPQSSTPTRTFRAGYVYRDEVNRLVPEQIDLPYNGQVENLLDKLLDYQNRAGIEYDSNFVSRLVDRLADLDTHNAQNSQHLFVFLRSERNTAFEEGILEKVREAANRTIWINSEIHIENARAEYVDLTIMVDNLTQPDIIRQTLLRAANDYLYRASINATISYNDFFAYLRRYAQVSSYVFSTSILALNDGLTSEVRKSLPLRALNSRGLVLQETMDGNTIRYLTDSEIQPAYPYSAWKLRSVNVAPSTPSDKIRAGDLLACKGTTAFRANFDGTTNIIQNDPICSEGNQ
jgi:hypothetical protein